MDDPNMKKLKMVKIERKGINYARYKENIRKLQGRKIDGTKYKQEIKENPHR